MATVDGMLIADSCMVDRCWLIIGCWLFVMILLVFCGCWFVIHDGQHRLVSYGDDGCGCVYGRMLGIAFLVVCSFYHDDVGKHHADEDNDLHWFAYFWILHRHTIIVLHVHKMTVFVMIMTMATWSAPKIRASGNWCGVRTSFQPSQVGPDGEDLIHGLKMHLHSFSRWPLGWVGYMQR